MRNRFSGEAGAAAVEFAMVLPIFVLLVLGISEFGRAYNYSVSLSGAAREGARVFALPLDTTDPETRTREAAPSIQPSTDINVACSIEGSPWATATCSSACTSGAKAGVRASYDFAYLPALSSMVQFFGGDPLGPITLKGIGVMRCGG